MTQAPKRCFFCLGVSSKPLVASWGTETIRGMIHSRMFICIFFTLPRYLPFCWANLIPERCFSFIISRSKSLNTAITVKKNLPVVIVAIPKFRIKNKCSLHEAVQLAAATEQCFDPDDPFESQLMYHQ